MPIKHIRVIREPFKHPMSVNLAMRSILALSLASVVMASLLPGAFADRDADLEFAGALEETLGHFWAIELNLDEKNAQLAAVHATHPIAELYDSMKPTLNDADPALDTRFQTVLTELKDKATTTVTRAQAQAAVDDAKDLVETVRDTVVAEGESADPDFKLLLMKGLLETSIAEYGEAVTDGAITEAAEFQDGSAFVWRSQQIFNEIKSDLDSGEAAEIEGLYTDLWTAYDEVASPDEVETLAGGIINEIDDIVDANRQADLEFAGALEETLGHFWAIELNLDEKNAQLAAVHATHPIAELYDSMKPTLNDADSALDTRFQTVLTELKDKATTTVTRAQAQAAVDDAKDLVETVRDTVVAEGESADPDFKLLLMKGLLETSIAEYGEAVTDGAITEAAEFQDGSAFVWRSQQIFNEIKSDLDTSDAETIEGLYGDLWTAYDEVASPDEVETLAGGIISKIDEITGFGGEGNSLLNYVATIKTLLTDAKSEYRQGNTDLALSYATKAYLDNYEFLEGPLIDAGERELMEEVEVMMREELRQMIRDGAPVSEVDEQIDLILIKMDTVEMIVPEFGAIVMVVLASAMAVLVVVNMRSRLTIWR